MSLLMPSCPDMNMHGKIYVHLQNDTPENHYQGIKLQVLKPEQVNVIRHPCNKLQPCTVLQFANTLKSLIWLWMLTQLFHHNCTKGKYFLSSWQSCSPLMQSDPVSLQWNLRQNHTFWQESKINTTNMFLFTTLRDGKPLVAIPN